MAGVYLLGSDARAPTSSSHYPIPAQGKTLIKSFSAAQRAAVAKDISWLWRTAYNCAVQGCADWEAEEEAASDLFDVAREVISPPLLDAGQAHAKEPYSCLKSIVSAR